LLAIADAAVIFTPSHFSGAAVSMILQRHIGG
jgi:hypothetical protein